MIFSKFAQFWNGHEVNCRLELWSWREESQGKGSLVTWVSFPSGNDILGCHRLSFFFLLNLYPLGRSRGFSLNSLCSGQYTGGMRLHQWIPAEHFCTRGHRASCAERGLHWWGWLQIWSDQNQVGAGGLSGQRWNKGQWKKSTREGIINHYIGNTKDADIGHWA